MKPTRFSRRSSSVGARRQQRPLENFKNLMVEPVEGTITLESLFDSYWVSSSRRTSTSLGAGKSTPKTSRPTVEPANALLAEVVSDERPLLFASSFENANLYLHVDVIPRIWCASRVRLTRWKHDW